MDTKKAILVRIILRRESSFRFLKRSKESRFGRFFSWWKFLWLDSFLDTSAIGMYFCFRDNFSDSF